MALLATIGLLFSKSLTISCILLFIFGFNASGVYMVSGTFNSEMLTPDWRKTMNIINMTCKTSAFILQPFFFLYVSNNIEVWFGISISISICSMIGFIVFLDESPLWLLKTGKIDQANLVIRKMMKINGVKDTVTLNSVNEPLLK